MKILHIIFSLDTGGAETMLVDIINEQSKTQKVELLIVNNIVNKDLIESINKAVKIHYLNRVPGGRNPLPILQFNYKVFKINPTVIHFHNHNGIKLLKYKIKAAICLTIHTINVPIDNFFKYNKLFSISNAVQEDVLFRGGGSNSIVIYNGIKFDDIEINCNYDKIEKYKIIQVSRLDQEIKGQHILIKAISILVERGIDNIQLDLIGEGSSQENLKKLVKNLNIENNVNFLGTQPRIYIYKNLKNYQLLVQPSLFEGFGLTIIEGMAAKIPILISDIEGPMEIIENGKYGYFFESGNVEDLADKINSIITKSTSQEHCKLIERAYQHVRDNFDIVQTASNYLKYY